MKKLRLLVTQECNKACKGCCNKDWDLDKLPSIEPEEYANYDEILITGGEPTYPFLALDNALSQILTYKKSSCKVYVYTNGYNVVTLVSKMLTNKIDGITLTLHNESDILALRGVQSVIEVDGISDKSLRLHIFKGIAIPDDINLSFWKVKDNIEWIENCTLPVDEEFRKIKNI